MPSPIRFCLFPPKIQYGRGPILRRDSLPKLYAFKIVTDPDSVAVLLDDSLKGASPCTLSGVVPGPHLLTLKKKGYYLKKAEITADSATPQEFTFSLLKPAFLSVISAPAGAAVSIDGQSAGTTPYANDKVKPGDHVIKLERKQYSSVEKTLSIKSGGADTLHVQLEHTVAYNDSIAAAQQATAKLHKDRNTFAVVSGIFCLCAIALIIFEAGNQ